MTMSLMDGVAGVVIVLLAYTVRGIAGFGSGLIAVPLLSIFFPLTLVVPLVVALDYAGSAGQGYRNRHEASWRDLYPLMPSTVLGVVAALFIFRAMDGAILQLALGVFVLVLGSYQLLGLPAIRATRLAAVPYGLLGGLVGTLFGTGGPFYVLYLGMRGLDKAATRASFAMWFVIDGAVRLSGYATAGIATVDTAWALLFALPVAGMGMLIGGRIQVDFSQDVFKKFVSVLLVVSGLTLILK